MSTFRARNARRHLEEFMKLPHRRQFLHLAAGAAALPAVSHGARAQFYPSRPVRIIVGFAAGGSVDLFARLMGQWLSERLGQPFIIENRAGAGGNIGTEAVVRAAPDGYTLLLVTAANAINESLFDRLNFNFIRDMTPIATIHRGIGVVVVNPSFPMKSVAELIAHAKANPGKTNMASGGNGSAQHIYGEYFKMMADVDMLHVPYRGTPAALTALVAGEVQVMIDTLSTSIEQIRSGRLRALAVTASTRSEALPDVPTLGEFVPGYEATVWLGMGAPRNTPPEIIERLNKEVNAGLADPKIKARIADLGYTPFMSSSAEFGRFIVSETEKWGNVVRAANIKPE
jgi:tripartite-type tricarboxylate transporter receptor subunit TctC